MVGSEDAQVGDLVVGGEALELRVGVQHHAVPHDGLGGGLHVVGGDEVATLEERHGARCAQQGHAAARSGAGVQARPLARRARSRFPTQLPTRTPRALHWPVAFLPW